MTSKQSTLNTGTAMPTFEQHRQRLEQVLKANRKVMEALANELGDALCLYEYVDTEENLALVQALELSYKVITDKVDSLNSIYQQFLQDGIAPEWL